MTIRNLIAALLESGIDIDAEISITVEDSGEWRYISPTNNVVDYDDGTCAIVGNYQ